MKKFKKIIFLACFVMLIAVMAIAVSAASAYKTDRTVDVDLTKLPEGTKKVGDEVLTGDSVTLPLYQKNEDGTYDALTWYIVTTTESDDTTEGTADTTEGTTDTTVTTVITLVSTPTKDIMYLDGEYLKFTDDGKNIRANIVVFNVQDDTIDGWRTTNKWGGVTNTGIQTSAYLQYIYFGDKTTGFYAIETFKECTNLKGVYFTANSELISTNDKTFAGCSSLTEVTLPPKLTTIGSAFRDTGLTTISIPASVTSLTLRAFYNCTSLKEVVFAEGSSLETIGNEAFYGCTSLTSINIPNGASTIGELAFYGCSALTSVNIPDSVTGLGNRAFSTSGLTAVTISASITTMGTYVFNECTSLEKVVFAEGSSITGTYTFYGCTSLKSVNIPNSITEIGDYAFYGCSALTSINDPTDPTTINISDSVTRIGRYAFNECSSLKKVTLPNSVTTVGDRAFRNCSSLEYINFGASLITFELDGANSYIFYNSNALKTVVMPATIKLSGTEQNLFAYGSSSIKFFFTGTEDEVNALKTALGTTSNKKFTNATLVEYDATNKGAYDTAYDYYNSLSGAYIIYGYNKCEAFYVGVHAMSATPVLAYVNGFDKEGTSTCTCTRECGYSKSTTIDPIFAALGYSIKGTNDAIYAGFTVNAEALKNYNAYIVAQGENALKYGIVIVNMGATVASDANLAFGTDGVVSNEKAIQVEINNSTFTRFGFTLTGFGDTTKGLNLVISAYVIESETDAKTDTTTVKNVSFVQQAEKDVSEIAGIDNYYTAKVKANGSETKTLGTMTLTQLLALTGKGVVTEDTTTTETTNGESASGGDTGTA